MADLIQVDHDYGGTDNLRYITSDGRGIGDATVKAYLISDYNAGNLGDDYVVASVTTSSDGRWSQTISLEVGTYTLVFSKDSVYGPDAKAIAVREPSAPTYEESQRSLEECQPVCGHSCVENVFDRVHVRPVIAGGTRIEWELAPDFADPQPHTFQLQVGRTGLTDADDWTDVGLPAEDAYFLIDDSQRAFGKTQWTHYRVKLSTLDSVYYSEPTPCLGDLSFRDFRLARAIQRAELVRFRQMAGQEGYLLKRRIAGEKCTECRDFQTDEVVDADCENCYGTGFTQGYFEPKDCVWAALSEQTRHEELNATRATVNDIIVAARMLAEPQLNEEDVWIAKNTDLRWFVHTIKHIAEMRGFPLVYTVELRLAEYSHPIYTISMP